MIARRSLAMAAMIAAVWTFSGCGSATAPSADKMAKADLEFRRAYSTTPATANSSPIMSPDMTITDEQAEAIERTGVSVASYREGLRKMEQDPAYKAEVGRHFIDLAFPVPGGGPRRRHYHVTARPPAQSPAQPGTASAPAQGQSLRPVNHVFQYTGKGTIRKAFDGTGFGVVFEDDGQAGYIYATNEGFTEVFEAVEM